MLQKLRLTVCGFIFSFLKRDKHIGTKSRYAWHSWQIVWFPYSRFIFLSLVSQLGALGLCCGTFELLHTALPNPCSLGDLPYIRSAYAMLCPVFLCYCVRPPSPPLSGLIHPYWSRINSEKTCPLMVFWNLSVWAFNGAENWIVPKDCWAKKNVGWGHFLRGGLSFFIDKS